MPDPKRHHYVPRNYLMRFAADDQAFAPVDDQVLDETNLGRHVGARADDVDRTLKTAIAHRLAAGVDPTIAVIEVPDRFPSPRAIAVLKGADVVVACFDRFDAREGVNAFCRRYLIRSSRSACRSRPPESALRAPTVRSSCPCRDTRAFGASS